MKYECKMEKVAGIPVDVLDRIKINLQYKTALDLNMCKAAREYWRDELKEATLPVTAATLRKFSKQRDGDGLIEVGVWVEELYYNISDDNGWPRLETNKKMERALKVYLLNRYRFGVFDSLQGKKDD